MTNLTPEWNSQYIQYQYLKELLDKAIADAPVMVNKNEEDTDDNNPVTEEYFLRVDDKFFDVSDLPLCHFISFFSFI